MAPPNGNQRIPSNRMSIGFVTDSLAALWFLALARISHLFLQARDIEALNEASGRIAPDNLAAADAHATAQRIGWFIARVALRLPWRSDCLIQAMAAQKWLIRKNIPTRIVIGVDKTKGEGFLAHAWLRLGDTIITGGNIENYTVLLDRKSDETEEKDRFGA